VSENEIKGLLGPAVGYIDIADHYTNDLAKEDQEFFTKYSPLRPSSAGVCERSLAYSYAQYKGLAKFESDPKNPETMRLLDLGHAVEGHYLRHLTRAFEKMPSPLKLKYKQQVLSFFRLPDGHLIEGSLDSCFINEKFKVIIDVKSKKDKFSQFYKTSWEDMDAKFIKMKSVQQITDKAFWVEDLVAFLEELNDAFFAANFYQLNMYFFDEGNFIRERGIDHAAILQYNKNDSRHREIRFKPSEEAYGYVKEKFMRVSQVLNDALDQENTLEVAMERTKKEHTLGSASCAFCPYSKQCWPESELGAMKEHFSTYPKKRWPKDANRLKVYDEMQEVFDKYKAAVSIESERQKWEQKLIQLLDNEKVSKVKFSNDEIYEVKALKSGGVAGGPRKVLRRGKL
jgi:hypothetical protein